MDNKQTDAGAQKLRLMRIQTILVACILAILLIGGIFVAVQFKSMQNCIDVIEQDVRAIDMDALNRAVDAFANAADQFGKIDMEELNDAISALESAAEQLKDIDVDSLNSLVAALETVATRLQNTVNAISGFFGK